MYGVVIYTGFEDDGLPQHVGWFYSHDSGAWVEVSGKHPAGYYLAAVLDQYIRDDFEEWLPE